MYSVEIQNKINENMNEEFEEESFTEENYDNIPSLVKELTQLLIDNDEENKENKENKENISNLNNLNTEINSNNDSISVYNLNDNIMNNLKRSCRIFSLLNNDNIGFQYNIKECSLCFKKINKYGLLSNCDDIFCYECIKQWRKEAIQKNKRELFRRCPICNVESYSVISSRRYIIGEEKKKKFQEHSNRKKIMCQQKINEF
jgi:hypothetical protein